MGNKSDKKEKAASKLALKAAASFVDPIIDPKDDTSFVIASYDLNTKKPTTESSGPKVGPDFSQKMMEEMMKGLSPSAQDRIMRVQPIRGRRDGITQTSVSNLKKAAKAAREKKPIEAPIKPFDRNAKRRRGIKERPQVSRPRPPI